MNAVLMPDRRKISVDDYHRMDDAGIFGPEESVELLDGEIYVMPPIGNRHMALVSRLARLLHENLGRTVNIRVQGSVVISNFSQPQPDICILRARDDDYFKADANPEDILLAIEVSDSSLRFDRITKLPLYLSSGITEVWILNVADRCIEAYPSQRRYAAGDIVHATEIPKLAIDMNELFRHMD
jgi:Uma2 family endonuclease